MESKNLYTDCLKIVSIHMIYVMIYRHDRNNPSAKWLSGL